MQELKTRNAVDDVIAAYVNLRRSGRNLSGLCPFHHEKSPSLTVYPENGSFYCFGCGVGGDVITFIRQIENLDYMEAVRFLAQRAGLPVPENQADDGMGRVKAKILEINRDTARFYHSVLQTPQGAPGMDYLRGRGLSLSTIRHFGLGFSPPSRFELVDFLRKKGYHDDELVQANVAFQSRNGRAIDRFFGRVMYPLIDLRGNVIAFGGRILTDEKPKYLNTSDTLVFRKSNALFAMNFAKNVNSGQLILAEGYMDVISLHQAGFQNAVATLGTALTQEQAHLMSRYAKEVVVCYDSDEAGQKAASRAIPLLRGAGLLVKVLTITGGKDPDEYIRSHGESGHARFQQLLDACGNDVEYRLAKIRADCDLKNAEGRVAYLTSAAEVIAGLENSIERDVYAGRLAAELSVDKAAIMQQVSKISKKQEKGKDKREFREFQRQVAGIRDSVNPDKAQHLRAASAEEALLAYIQKYPDHANGIYEKCPPEKFATSFNRRIYKETAERLLQGKEAGLMDISGELTPEESAVVARIYAQYSEVSVTEQDAREYIRVILEEYEKTHIGDVSASTPEDIETYLQNLRMQKK